MYNFSMVISLPVISPPLPVCRVLDHASRNGRVQGDMIGEFVTLCALVTLVTQTLSLHTLAVLVADLPEKTEHDLSEIRLILTECHFIW